MYTLQKTQDSLFPKLPKLVDSDGSISHKEKPTELSMNVTAIPVGSVYIDNTTVDPPIVDPPR